MSEYILYNNYEAVDAICEQYNIVAIMNTDNKGDAAVDTQKYLKIRTADTPDGGFCYALATPQTYNLTPTQINSLLGVNNVWADTGDMEKVEYVRDATTVINDILARLDALEG